MTKTVRQEYIDAVREEVHQQVNCMRIVRTDGQVLRFVSGYDTDLMMSNGKIYKPDNGGFDPTAVSHNSDFSSVTIDLDGITLPEGIDRADIEAGFFDYADVYFFRTLADDPVEDDEKLISGKFGTSKIKDDSFSLEFRSLADLSNQNVVREQGPMCDADFGGPRCQFVINPPDWQPSTAYAVRPDNEAEVGDVVKPTVDNGYHFKCIIAGTSDVSEPVWATGLGSQTADGSVTWEAVYASFLRNETVTAVNDIVDIESDSGNLISQPNDHWGGNGSIKFTSGDNAEISREIEQSYATNGQLILWEQFPYPINVGDTFEISAGCRKRLAEDCRDKWNNKYNFQGFPHVPGEDKVSLFGGQT